ncbi:MAG: ABC transporter substrate-binding protein [Clostridia bacterium]|nr:ABC transporter substrate-binding protein [Clostridia bacterium]
MKKTLSIMLLLSLLFLAGCSKVEPTVETPVAVEPEVTEPVKLIVGVMPAVDAAPIFLAKEQGYFEEMGINVEIQLFTNAQDRQSALQTGAIDGAMSDMIALITNVQGGFDLKGTTLTDGMFPVLVRDGFEEKNEVTVAMMEVSVSNYLADEWLSNDYTVEKIYINEIPARLEMIKNGNVDMGIFPEPLATMGTLDGLEKRIFETKDGYCPDVFVFTGKAIEEKSEAIEAYHRAIDLAVKDIQDDDGLARDILIEKLKLKPEIRDLIDLPEYKLTNLPDRTYAENIIEWTSEVLGKEIDIDAESLFERKFVN